MKRKTGCLCCGGAIRGMTGGPQICNRCIIEAVNERTSLQAVRRAAELEPPRAEEEDDDGEEDDS